MELSATDHKRRRGAAKGQVTRAIQAINRYVTQPVATLDTPFVLRLQAQVLSSTITFYDHHDALPEVDEAFDASQHDDEGFVFQSSVAAFDKVATQLVRCGKAWVLSQTLIASLEDLESGLADGYSSVLQSQYSDIEAEFVTFRELISPPDVRTHKDIIEIRTCLLERWRKANQVRARSVSTREHSPAGSLAPAAPRTERHSVGVRVDPPTFNGRQPEFQAFKALLSQVLDKQTHLSDVEKNAVFLKSMLTAETKAQAVSAIKGNPTFEQALALFSVHYEIKKEVMLYHLNDLLRTAPVGPNRPDIKRLLQTITDDVAGLKEAKGFTATQILATYLEGKLTSPLRLEWRKATATFDEPPDLNAMEKFLHQQLHVVEGESVAVVGEEKHSHPKHKQSQPKPPVVQPKLERSVFKAQKSRTCSYCRGEHSTFSCSGFKAMTPAKRQEWVKEQRRCFNCLGENHRVDECKSERSCHDCKRRHHSLLHLPTWSKTTATSDPVTLPVTTKINPESNMTITALATVSAGGLQQRARMLLDTGAEVTLISKELATTLGARRLPAKPLELDGVGHAKSLYSITLTLYGDECVEKGDERIEIVAHVMEKLPQLNGCVDLTEVYDMPFLKDVPLADPGTSSEKVVDIILDATAFYHCRLGDTIMSPIKGLIADKTIFGWILGGANLHRGINGSTKPLCYRAARQTNDLDDLLQQQWLVEQLPDTSPTLSIEEVRAQDHFTETHTRLPDGRYEVSLPRLDSTPVLGESREQAVCRYNSVERSLRRKGTWDEYQAAVQDFISQGHAELVPPEDLSKPASEVYYMPMHGVVKTTSTTTKVRPVCDASAPTSTGTSLNDTILAGPSLYQPLPSIINRFRESAVAMTADVSKMYRQISLAPHERDFHRFLFRGSGGELLAYRMTRLTFGVKSSPYLASRVLRQVGSDEEKQHPEAAEVIRTSFYMDDVLTGAETVEQAQHKRADLNDILEKGGMPLCKWRSNSKELLASIPEHLQESTDLKIVASPADCQKTLGLHWSTSSDCMFAATPNVEIGSNVTKRRLASTTARIFDPMGWFAPAVMPARILTQEAWALKVGWDHSLPSHIFMKWSDWVQEMPRITEHPVQRHFGLKNHTIISRELHGFSDASTVGFGGVVFLRTFYSDLEVTVDLVSSKARVAPLKTLTIPRLELCGAVVLAKLLRAVATDLKIDLPAVYAWTDSTIVLGWLQHSPSKLAVFVGNRIATIADLVPPSHWRHVPGKQNPADCLSRGLNPKALLELPLWWKGPPWLSLEAGNWPTRPDLVETQELPEIRKTVLTIPTKADEMGVRHSTLTRWIRVVAWMKRFTANASKSSTRNSSTFLSLDEQAAAKTTVFLISQLYWLPDEYKAVSQGKPLHKHHSLLKLTPFIGADRLLRVGGRLQQSDLPQTSIHPIILSAKSHTVRLLAEHTHRSMCHTGSSAVMATLSYSFHIPRLKPLLRSISRKCRECQIAYARPAKQQMGDLPSVRCAEASTFASVGVDYAGPVFTTTGRGKNFHRWKTYLCIFICMATKAIHVEVVADATTEGFLAALDRFVGRRGRPAHIYSDNGGNFVGAEAELRTTTASLRTEETQRDLRQWCSRNDIKWHFIPPKTPNIGGLWEAAVKSVKTLIRKSLRTQNCSMDELVTLAISAEAVLNSRPYLPIHSTSDDAVCPLTPAHFLIGRPLTALPQKVDLVSKMQNVRRWNLVRRLEHQWWQQWRKEFVPQFSQKAKCLTPQTNLKVDDVVLILDETVFKQLWPIGRVTAVHPGPDKLVRIVDVLWNGKVLRRPICKLVKLPTEADSACGGECSGVQDTPEMEDQEENSMN